MAEKGFKRKLTAILSADVKEYVRLMGQSIESIRLLIVHHLFSFKWRLYSAINRVKTYANCFTFRRYF